MDSDKIFRAAIETFGTDTQLNVAQEELAELIAAISRVKRGRPNAKENLIEEVADSLVVIRQLILAFDIEVGVTNVFYEKTDRLQKRVENGRDW